MDRSFLKNKNKKLVCFFFKKKNEIFSNTVHVYFYKVYLIKIVRNKPIAQYSPINMLQQGGPLASGNMGVQPNTGKDCIIVRCWEKIEVRYSLNETMF